MKLPNKSYADDAADLVCKECIVGEACRCCLHAERILHHLAAGDGERCVGRQVKRLDEMARKLRFFSDQVCASRTSSSIIRVWRQLVQRT